MFLVNYFITQRTPLKVSHSFYTEKHNFLPHLKNHCLFQSIEKPKISIPLSVVRSVPKHYTWFMVEGTPPIQAWLANSSTRLEGGPVVKGLKFTQTGNYTILVKNDAGNSSKTVDVNVMGKVFVSS